MVDIGEVNDANSYVMAEGWSEARNEEIKRCGYVDIVEKVK